MRWVASLLALLVLASASPAAAQLSAPPAAQIVVVGVPGLRWSDVSERATPALARMQREGASGVLSVKTAAQRDCPAAGWLTLGAGNRVLPAGGVGAGDEAEASAVCAEVIPAPASLPDQVRVNAIRREGARPGLLAEALRSSGSCVDGVGSGGKLAAADPQGLSGPARAPGTCPVLLREASDVAGANRAAAAGAADRVVAQALRDRPADGTVLVIGVSEALGDTEAHLHVALALGPRFGPGALTSASTRRSPYVQLVDVAPTVLSLLGLDPPRQMIGEPWRSTGPTPALGELRDESRKAHEHRRATVPFFVVLVAAQLLLLGLFGWRRRWWSMELTALAAVCAVGASYLANLVPWWRADRPLVVLLAATAAVTAAMTAVCLVGRRPMSRVGLACGLVAAVIVIDLLLGGRLQMSSVAGYSPLVAGRFAGIGNVAFGVLAASVLLAAASTRSATAAALTALVVVVDGAPQWGSDVGGVLALVPAYAVLVLLLSGRTATFGRVAAASAVGVGVVVAFAVADHAREPADQTHLGRFVGQVLNGSAMDVLQRKAAANVALLLHSPVTAMLPVLVLVVLLLLLRPPLALRRTFEQAPQWRAGLLAVATASGLGFLLNDSGVAVPALAILIAVPATVAVLARHAREETPAG